MNKTIALLVISIFFSNIYVLPSLSAITLGEIKSENESGSAGYDSEKKGVTPEKDDKKKPLSEEKAPGEKTKEINPRLVCLLSVVMPGGGHFYLGNDAKGIAFCLAAGFGYTVSGFFFVKTMLADIGSVQHRNYLLLTGFFFFITLIVHFVGII